MHVLNPADNRNTVFRQINANFAEAGGGSASVAWLDITGKPVAIAAGATQAEARAAIGAGTSNLALGNAANQAAAGNHTHGAATASTAGFMTAAMVAKLNGIAESANNYTLPAAGASIGGVKKSAAVADSTATDVAGIVADLNAVLAALRAAGIMSA